MKLTRAFINKIILFVTFLLIPTNLGLHLTLQDSYVSGLLINFLQPTLYLQDILIWIYIILNIDNFSKVFIGKNKYYIWFFYTLFLSTLVSSVFLLSFSLFLRTFSIIIFGLLALTSNKKEELKKTFVYALTVSTLFISTLGIAQWFHQGSIFDNYLFLGEQPYSMGTYGITLENFFGKAKVPPYSTFMHPNTFAGFLVISLFLILPMYKKNLLYKASFATGTIALFLTWSKVAWLAYVVSLAYYFVKKSALSKYIVYSVIFIAFAALFLPVLPIEIHKPSIYRRVDLLDSTYRLLKDRPFFGYGIGTTPSLIDKNFPLKHDIAFIHPPHNIFVLLPLEAGFISLGLFLLIIISKKDKSKAYKLFLLQIIILGSFDHYLLTMPQTHMLMWFGTLFL